MSASSAPPAAVTPSASSHHTTSTSTTAAHRDPTLVVRDLRKRFGDTTAVDGVGFDVGAHEVLCLVGPSGCGKSTALRMVAGLIRPDSGQVSLDGEQLDGPGVHVPPERRSIGIVFQDHALFPNLDVSRNISFGLTALDRSGRRRRVGEMLDLVGLSRYAARYPHELSGGERQRVALARALAPEPAVLLLDEPFASLDQNLRVKVRDDVLSILRATATPAVFVTHDQLEALSLGDRLVVLSDGRVEQTGTPQEVFHSPASRFVASFMGEADFLPATVEGGVATSELGARAMTAPPPSGPVEMVLRPDDVVLTADPDGAAVVTCAEFQGSSVLSTVLLPSGGSVRSRQPHSAGLDIGTRVRVELAEHHRTPVLLPRRES